ncbi:efflux RND transporter periplasmic adaptor subunit [Luteibacter aegosomatissinici]|uniref:efflux RND transporter periplasmic adaptor subunit n=1 Tax=Luteibacter aegosomatissinici TaxID=2911539 RepID=UPI001FFAC0BD|nr:efflux RND transporter periplasmic adaptor subunit [Luteibacter aegosomatissinici]UPG94730.1 efflux RND transporter periplasmic adaptor subunit [Luteibacter aegosomatissinici]
MANVVQRMLPGVVTLAVVVAAIAAGVHVWHAYDDLPWTRDAHIRADTVQVSPDVSGLVTDVLVHDNDVVKRGQPLFVVDRARFELAVRRAEAAVEEQRSSVAELRREDARNRAVSDLVAREAAEQVTSKLAAAEARLHADETAADTARLDLERTVVKAPADGTLNDHVVRVGDYVSAGHAPFAMVDGHSFHVDGYFEETRLHGVKPGQPVTIKVMGEQGILHGRVQSVAGGIADRERANSTQGLPDINPTFNWVRLAQRIPVRISIEDASPDLLLVAGRTATVTIRTEDHAGPKS